PVGAPLVGARSRVWGTAHTPPNVTPPSLLPVGAGLVPARTGNSAARRPSTNTARRGAPCGRPLAMVGDGAHPAEGHASVPPPRRSGRWSRTERQPLSQVAR